MYKIAPSDSVKRLDEIAHLLHLYTFSLVGDRDELVAMAYDLVTGLALDIVALNAPKEPGDEN